MAEARVDQPSFSHGQLDVRVQSRADWADYYKAAKEISNGLVIPQGGVQRRWGTFYVDRCTVVGTDFTEAEIETLIYNDNTVYLLLWEALSLKIYLENRLVATLVTQYTGPDIQTLRFSQVQTRLIINTGNYQNQQLVRSNDAPVAITGFSAVNNTLTAALVYGVATVLPAQFTGGPLPTTTPQIFANRDYFITILPGNTFRIFSNTADAYDNVNFYTITNAGVGATVIVQNTWTLSNIPFKFYPAYDFDGGYFAAAFTFTPSAVSGAAINITASAPIFTAAMVGGLYIGNGGIVRLTAFTSNVVMVGYTVEAFPNTNAIRGDLSFLGEPAWSNNRGWPKHSTFFQNRLVFANTRSLPNGQWLSVINDVYNFDDSQTLADDSIASYPESGSSTVIQSMTSGRSLVVHGNTANYSTPVQAENVLTPTNYVLTEQNKFGVGLLQPVFIDNQIYFVDRSNNNIINMIWEFTQSSYVTNNVSVQASTLLDQPVDMAAFDEPNFIDGFYVIFVNGDGTLCVLQSLREENVKAYSISNTKTYQTLGSSLIYSTVDSSYIKVTTAKNRCWFLVDRLMPIGQASTAITGFTATTITSAAHGMTIGAVTMIEFTIGTSLPTTTPQITLTSFFWAVATDANNFRVYASYADAAANVNAFVISSAGTGARVVRYVDTHRLFIEEVDFNFYTDSSREQINTVASATVFGLDHLNGNVVQIVADGYVLNDQVVQNGVLTLPAAYFDVKVGLKYRTRLIPLPPAIPGVPGSFYQQRHIRNLYINYYQTIGSQIQSFGVPVVTMQQIIVGALPVPQDGVFEYTLMEGWDGATPVDIEIVQEAPLPMTINGLSYILEV